MDSENSREASADFRRSRHAKRSSLACANCKRTKRKCDVEHRLFDAEGCTSCRMRSEPCEVRFGEDKRRKRGTRRSNNRDVQSRPCSPDDLELAAQANQSNGNIITIDGNETDSRPRQVERTLSSEFVLPRPPAPQSRFGRESTSSTGSTTAAARQFLRQMHAQRVQDSAALAEAEGNPAIATISQTSSPGDASKVASVASQSEASSSIMGRVIARESGLESQVHENTEYFGATSIYHLSDRSHGDQDMTGASSAHAPEQNMPWVDIPPDLDTSNEPEPVVSHLLDLFWEWQFSLLQVFPRKLFMEDKRLYDTEKPRRRYNYFSPSLLYGIMAISAMISPDRGIRYYATTSGGVTGDVFFDKAKRLLDQEIGYPSITTVQTAILLGARYGTFGQNALGWIYSGISLRMAIQLGLQVNCEKAVALKQMSPEMAEVRTMVFWGCYIQDKLWSAYCGRPSCVMDWDISINIPETPKGPIHASSDPEIILDAVHRSFVALTVKGSKILSELYSHRYRGDPQSLRNSANALHVDLFKWHHDLPEALTWPNNDATPSSPHVLLLHMQFYFTLLLLHRPFIDLNSAMATINHLDDAAPSATRICTLAATNIAKLTRDYSLLYNLRQIPSPAIHFIFTASTIHLINYQISRDKDYEYLFQGCLSGLAEISASYPIGHKAVRVLQTLARRLQSHQSQPRGDVLARHEKSNFLPPPLGHYAAQSPSNRSSHRDGTMTGEPRPTVAAAAAAVSTLGNMHHHPSPRKGSESITGPGHSSSRSNFGTGFADETGAANTVSIADLEHFDWSAYNSPIALPMGWNDIDLDNVFLNSGGGGAATDPAAAGGTAAFMSGQGLPLPHDGMTYWPFNTAHVADNRYALDSDTTIFDKFYGTAYGLHQSYQ